MFIRSHTPHSYSLARSLWVSRSPLIVRFFSLVPFHLLALNGTKQEKKFILLNELRAYS